MNYRFKSLVLSLCCILIAGCATSRVTTSFPSTDLMKQHLNALRSSGLEQLIIDAANQPSLPCKLPPTLLYAIASRETNCKNIMGDNYNGIGLMQIDIRHHDIAKKFKKTGEWKTNPGPLINYSARLLCENLKSAKERLSRYPAYIQLYAAVSKYNCGSAIERSAKNGLDSDQCTTGRNYAHDVMLRKKAFDEILRNEALGR